MRILLYASAIAILASFVFGLFVVDSLPARMATHWDLNGNVNGTMPRALTLIFTPAIATLLLVVFVLLPRIDPKARNADDFKAMYYGFMFLLVAFLSYIHIIILLLNLGYAIDAIRLIAPAFGITFYYLGAMMAKTRQNWFVGIRTPWTLSDDRVWEKTHNLAGHLFKMAGISTTILLLIDVRTLPFVIAGLLAMAVYLVGYSFVLYRELPKEQDGTPAKKKKKRR